jgi:hypothetical protein
MGIIFAYLRRQGIERKKRQKAYFLISIVRLFGHLLVTNIHIYGVARHADINTKMCRETVAKMSIQNYREIFASLCDGSLSKNNDSCQTGKRILP